MITKEARFSDYKSLAMVFRPKVKPLHTLCHRNQRYLSSVANGTSSVQYSRTYERAIRSLRKSRPLQGYPWGHLPIGDKHTYHNNNSVAVVGSHVNISYRILSVSRKGSPPGGGEVSLPAFGLPPPSLATPSLLPGKKRALLFCDKARTSGDTTRRVARTTICAQHSRSPEK